MLIYNKVLGIVQYLYTYINICIQFSLKKYSVPKFEIKNVGYAAEKKIISKENKDINFQKYYRFLLKFQCILVCVYIKNNLLKNIIDFEMFIHIEDNYIET